MANTIQNLIKNRNVAREKALTARQHFDGSVFASHGRCHC